MAEQKAKRDPNRCPSHPGAVLDEILQYIRKSKTEIAEALGFQAASARHHRGEEAGQSERGRPDWKAGRQRPGHLASFAGSPRCVARRREVDVSEIKMLEPA
ncbi:hypothetical protein ACVIG9_005137 [Bradyrhizobium ottawaense]